MAKLLFITNTSLDGYIEDKSGNINFPDAVQIHPLVIELLQPVGTYIFGRRLYDSMIYWDAPVDSFPPEFRDFARVWQKPEKIVFSRTMTAATMSNARLERNFDAAAIQKLKRESEYDITIGGAELAGLALEADLVDECHLIVHPLILGGGKPAFQPGLERKLELFDSRRVGTGVVYLHYRVQQN